MLYRRIIIYTFSIAAWLCLFIMAWCAILISETFSWNLYGEMYFEFFLINIMCIIFFICIIIELKTK